jgi:hypothetical protein
MMLRSRFDPTQSRNIMSNSLEFSAGGVPLCVRRSKNKIIHLVKTFPAQASAATELSAKFCLETPRGLSTNNLFSSQTTTFGNVGHIVKEVRCSLGRLNSLAGPPTLRWSLFILGAASIRLIIFGAGSIRLIMLRSSLDPTHNIAEQPRSDS